FYNAGCTDPKGLRHGVVAARRLLRRILRPMFFHLAELLRQLADQADGLAREQDALAARQDQLDQQVQTAPAFGWDYVALGRRLATLEDQVDQLLQRNGAESVEVSIPFHLQGTAEDQAPARREDTLIIRRANP